MVPAKEPGSPVSLRDQALGVAAGNRGCLVRAALKLLEQRRRKGQARTKYRRQNFGWKAGVEEGRDQQVGEPVKPGVGAGDPPGGTSGASPGRLPSPSPDWQAACDQPRAPQRPGRPGERERPPAGVGGGARLYIAARSRPAQRARRRAPLLRVPAWAARPALLPNAPCSRGSCRRLGAPSLASRSSISRALPARVPAVRSRRPLQAQLGLAASRAHGPRAGMAGPGAAAAALLPAVLLAVLAPWAGRGGAAAPTAPNGTLGAELERRWESLVARSLARLPVAAQPKEAAVQSGAGDYLLGIKRLRRLYCNVGIGFHLQVLPDGRIGGVHADTSDSEWGGPAQRVGGPGQRPPLPIRTRRSRLAPAGGRGNRDGLGFWSFRRRDANIFGPGNRRGDCLCAPGRTSPASPPSEARALGAEFQRLRPWAQGKRRSQPAPGGPREVRPGQAGLGGPQGRPAPAVGDWARPLRGRDRRLGTPRPCTLGSGAPLHPPPPQKRGPWWFACRGGGPGRGGAQGPLPGSDPRPAPRPAGTLAGGAGRGEHLRRGQPVLRGHEQQGQAVRLGEYRRRRQSPLPGRPCLDPAAVVGHRVGTASPEHKYPEAVPVTPGLSRQGAESHHRNSEVSPLPRAAPSSP